MKQLHTQLYDDAIRTSLAHLQQYPQMMPFIGAYWAETGKKILLLGESHYLPGTELSAEYPGSTYQSDWYRNSSEQFTPHHAGYIHTRNVINIADKVQEFGFKKPLSVFYNIKAAVKKQIPALSNEPHVFPYLSFYNYFQRPAFVEKASIINTTEDDAIAYQTLCKVTEVIRPSAIIFTSRKAALSFAAERNRNDGAEIFHGMTIDDVPHPGCAWWNKPSRAFGQKTGREKFLELIARES